MEDKYKRTCRNCELAYYMNPHYGVNYPSKYCTRTCYWEARKGVRVSPGTEFKAGDLKEKSRSWKGGKTITKHGYVQIYMPEHSNANTRGYVFEHRYVMEQSIGRKLDKKEVVHHINHDTGDNRIDNLMLFSSNSEHLRYEFSNGDRIPWNKRSLASE